MTVNFILSGQKTFIENIPEGIRALKLKPAIYSIECSREEGFFLLNIGETYTLPEKTYGDHTQAAERVIKTHYSKKGNTGILLTGLKGTGKSLFVKTISNMMLTLGIPVIQINKPYSGEDIFNFIENLGDCVLLFDEFGKNYSCYGSSGSQPTQAGLLSLLDGLSNSKRLHLFTENKVESISEYLIDRPGRVHYHFKYNRLSSLVITELCKDMEVPDNVTAELIELSTTVKTLSFDVVKCLINEWKLYGGKLVDHLQVLNIALCDNPKDVKVKLVSVIRNDGTVIPVEELVATIRPQSGTVSIDKKGEPNLGYRNSFMNFYLDLPVKIEEDLYTYVCEEGNTAVVKRDISSITI